MCLFGLGMTGPLRCVPKININLMFESTTTFWLVAAITLSRMPERERRERLSSAVRSCRSTPCLALDEVRYGRGLV